MGFVLLGPVEAWAGPVRVEVGSPRQRLLLAALAVDVGLVVPVEVLLQRLWDQDAPEGARRTLHSYVSRLRRIVAQVSDAAGRPVVVGRAGGYVLDVTADEVDLHRFRRLVDRARDQSCSAVRRLELLRDAVGLCRGLPLTGLAGEWAERMRRSWRQEQVDVLLAWAQAEVAVGTAAVALAPMAELASEHPLVEPIAAAHMRVLAGCGRVAEALACYARMRARLADELGADPGQEMQAVHQAVLRGEFERAPPSAGPLAGGASVVPAQLPADVRIFAGRRAELSTLDALLDEAGGAPTAVVIAGTGGAGKTALAVRWAHRIAARFPDGQLCADLRGFDPAGTPRGVEEVLVDFVQALGVPRQRIPIGVDAQAALYRSLLAGRRMLVLLDNAHGVDQIRSLLPGTPGCLVIVTSRDDLAGLVARNGAARVELDLLPLPDAVDLLRQLIGAPATDDPRLIATLAERCARLPLALRVAAELAAARPVTALAHLVAELADHHRRLDVLDPGGDAHTAVRAVLSCSYQHLSPSAARLFRLLGGYPAPDWDTHSTAALLAADPTAAARLLEELRRAHLLHPVGSDRYGMHDLLRAFGIEAGRGQDPEQDRQEALGRLFDYCLAGAAAAMDVLHPAEGHWRPGPPPASSLTPVFADHRAALAWLQRERRTLIGVAEAGARYGWLSRLTGLSATLWRQLLGHEHHATAAAIHAAAHSAASAAGDRGAQAAALTGLGIVHWRQGRLEQAAEDFDRAGTLYRAVADPKGEGRALNNLGMTRFQQGSYAVAGGHLRRAFTLFGRAGSTDEQVLTMVNLAYLDYRQGRRRRAVQQVRRAVARHDGRAETYSQALALVTLGLYLQQTGRRKAAGYWELGLRHFREAGERNLEATTLTRLADAYLHQGRTADALTHQLQALELFREIGDRNGEIDALNGLGEARRATGNPTQADAHHTAALALATETGDRYEQARAHHGLGHTRHTAAEPDQSRRHWQRALELYTQLGVPEAAEVRRHLADPDTGRPG